MRISNVYTMNCVRHQDQCQKTRVVILLLVLLNVNSLSINATSSTHILMTITVSNSYANLQNYWLQVLNYYVFKARV